MVTVTVNTLLCYIYQDVWPIWSRSQCTPYCVIFIKTLGTYGHGHSLHLIVLYLSRRLAHMVTVTVYTLLCYIYKDVRRIWSRSQFTPYCVIFIKTFGPYGHGHSLHLIVSYL